MKEALATYEYLKGQRINVDRRNVPASQLVDKINVHGYSGLKPGRDNQARAALRKAAGGKRIWVSEYGDDGGAGLELARTILDDLNQLRASAWVYWQPVEPFSTWGLVNAEYLEGPTMKKRGAPKWVYWKYHAFAQFTRFLRPGQRVLGTSHPDTVAGYDAAVKRLTIITLNEGPAQTIRYELSALTSVGAEASITFTRGDGKGLLSTASAPITAKFFTLEAAPAAIYSIAIDGARL